MTTKKILFEDFFKSTITENIADSGDVDFEVASAPVNKQGFIIINPESLSLRERMFYHNVIGNRIYVRGVNRYSPKEHLAGSTIQINDSALIFNYLSENVSTTFWVEKLGGLNVNIWGGPILLGTTMSEVSDTTLLLSNNAVNYIYFDLDSNTIKTTTSEGSAISDNGIIQVEITTASGQVSEINYRKYSIIKGVQGEPGVPGTNGLSAYEVAVNEGFIGTEEEWLLSLKGEKGDAGDIGNPGTTQEVNDKICPIAGSNVVYNDTNKLIGIQYPDSTTKVFQSNGGPQSSGIYEFDINDELITYTSLSGTYDNLTHSITYSDGMVVDGLTGCYTITQGNIAYTNKDNNFQTGTINTYFGDVIFKGGASFPYYRIDMTGTNDINYDGLKGSNQKCINLTTTGAKTLNFSNIYQGRIYGLIINNSSGGNITISQGTITNGNGVTTFHSLGTQISTLTLGVGAHFFYMATADTGIHISYTGLSGAF